MDTRDEAANVGYGTYVKNTGLCSLTDCLTAKLLLALASTVILGSESHGTHYHILLSDGSGSIQTSPRLAWSVG
jgi:hypothetical protein